MSRTLILTRHAKSSWDDPTQSDHDRPLNARGREAASALGLWMAESGRLPDEVLVSDARRARETWEGIAAELPRFPDVRIESRLYHSSPETLLRVLRCAQGGTALLIAHNPGIAEFAHRLSVAAPSHARFSDYPTGATTVLHFDIESWPELGWNGGKVVDFVVPRELKA